MSTNAVTVEGVIAGVYDLTTEAELDAVFQAYKERTKQIRARANAIAANDLAVGDVVRFTPGTRPKHLAGQRATVVERPNGRTKKFGYQVDADAPTPFAGQRIVGPASSVEKV